jgi:hypothetical protein
MGSNRRPPAWDPTGAKVNNKINDLCTLTSYSGALIAKGKFQRRPPPPKGWVWLPASPEVAAFPEQLIANSFED